MADNETKAPIVLAAVSGYLILSCLWRIFIPGGEYSMPPWPLVSLIFNFLMIALLFILKPQVPAAGPGSPALVTYATPLFAGGIAASVIMILIRFSGNKGWWTGHLM